MTHPRGSRYRNASARLPACGAVAQLGERLNGIQEVEGSTPFGSTLPFAGLGDLRAASEADRSRFVADDHDLSRRLLLVDGPARAIRCADAIRQASRALGLDVRAGLHTGECEMRGDDFRGIAVHIGARVADQAAGGEILVSSTVRDLVAGMGLRCERGRSRSGSAEKIVSPLLGIAARPAGEQPLFSTCEEARADVVPRGKTEASWVLRLGRSPLWPPSSG